MVKAEGWCRSNFAEANGFPLFACCRNSAMAPKQTSRKRPAATDDGRRNVSGLRAGERELASIGSLSLYIYIYTNKERGAREGERYSCQVHGCITRLRHTPTQHLGLPSTLTRVFLHKAWTSWCWPTCLEPPRRGGRKDLRGCIPNVGPACGRLLVHRAASR